MSLLNALGIGLAGALGSLCRWALGQRLPFSVQEFAWATFSANLLGCLLMGICWNRIQPEWLRLAVTVGFLGGFTTFSGFGLELLRYTQAGEWKLGIIYGAASLLMGVILVWVGQKISF